MIKDALDTEIDAKRAERETILIEFEALRSQLAHLEFELKTLERAAALRPSVGPTNRQHSTRDQRSTGSESHKGRQPGAISNKWRNIIKGIAAHYPGGALPEEMAAFGPVLGLINLRAADARRQAEKYVALGYLERVGERYLVTSTARERFGIESVSPVATSLEQDFEHRQEVADAA